MMPARASGVLLGLALSVLLSTGQRARAETNDDLRQRGLQAMQAQNFAAAREAFLQLVQREPSAGNYNYLATAEASAGQVDPAIAHLQKSIQLGNNTASAHYNLGILDMQAQRVDAAKETFQQAIDLDPHYLPARYGLGVALLSSGHPREAAALTEKSLQQTPHEARFWALLVSAQFVAGDSPKAIASTQSAVQDFPEEPRLDVTLATLCLRYGAVQRARELLENANELLPKDPEVTLLLAKASLMAGEPVEAMAVLQGMAPEDRKSPQRLLLMGETRALLGDLDAAEDDLRIALNDSPRDPECLASYAWLQNLRGNYEGAISTLTKARTILLRASWVPYGQAVSYYFLGKYAQAENACQESLQLDPKYAEGYFWRSKSLQAQGEKEKAITDLNTVIELNPGYADAYTELARLYQETGRPSRAAEVLAQQKQVGASSHPSGTTPSCIHSPTPHANPHVLPAMWLLTNRLLLGEKVGVCGA